MQEGNSLRGDEGIIRKAVQLLVAPSWEQGGVVELRALGTLKGIVSGYFDADHQDELVAHAARYSGCAQGIYITLNPVTRDCLARAANRAIAYAKHTTGDAEIIHRHWLLIDTDPTRPSGISAKDAEHDSALSRAIAIRSWLSEQGWPEPISADSGNGGHLLYRVDLPPDDEGLLHRVLKAIAAKHNDNAVKVDLSVYNAARISKLYGTFACKGDNISDRPHRMARLIETPQEVLLVARELLEAVASQSQATVPAHTPDQANDGKSARKQAFDLAAYLESHGAKVGKCKNLPNGTLWELKRCPWQPEKSGGGPFAIQFFDGGITAGCHHPPPCEGKGWDDLRDVIDPGWREAVERKGSKKSPSVAQRAIALAADGELFHTSDQRAFASLNRDDRRETWQIRSKPYKLLLRGRLHQEGIVANDSALDDAIATLESKALFDGSECSVYIRTAQAGGKLYIDLCNDAWEVVEVADNGWHVTSKCPVHFTRKEGMLPLPKPVEGGKVEQLRPFINVTDDDWLLAVAWLMAAIRPTGPYPILVVNGEHGSCKSTTCRRLRSLVDPNVAPIRKPPKDDQTLMIWATNSHVISLDNLSSMPTWLSDAMCRLAMGGSCSERALYSDDSEKLFFAVRPQMVNGIEDLAVRSDFLDRSLIIYAPVMSKAAREEEDELDRAFAEVYPAIFGAILTAASAGLKQLPEVKRIKHALPRLADFAKWMMAVEAALGWESGTFMQTMTQREDDSNESVVAGSLAAEAIRKFVFLKQSWNGTWTNLLDDLNKFAGEEMKRRQGWPHDSRALSNKLRLVAPNLRGVGIGVEFYDKERPKRVALANLLSAAKPGQQDTTKTGDRHAAKPQIACYGSDREVSPAEALYGRLWQFWATPLAGSVAAVAAPSLKYSACDGAEVIAPQ
jgi:hypothetical protein